VAAVELVHEADAGRTPHDEQLVDRGAGDRDELVGDPGGRRGDGLEDAAHHLGTGGPGAEPGRGPDLRLHVGRRQEAGIGKVNGPDRPGHAGRRRDQLLDGRVAPCGAALLEEPEAGHVLQEADTAERPGLIGEVGVSGLL
jgi:hypothetical protein